VHGVDMWIGLGVLGLLVGSFLNVVIHRLPIMIDREDAGGDARAARFDLAFPPSTCPSCGHRIRRRDNVPVLSYIRLRGRCAACGARISPRYPLVEILGAALPLAVCQPFTDPLQVAAAAVFVWFAVAIVFVDLESLLIPDALSLPLLWTGLLLAAAGVFIGPADAIVGAAAGYAALWLLARVAESVAGRPALGGGDVKLFAALGAWLGWQALPAVLFLACVLGTLTAVTLAAAGRHGRGTPVAFGPFLAAAGVAMLAWEPALRPLLEPLFLP